MFTTRLIRQTSLASALLLTSIPGASLAADFAVGLNVSTLGAGFSFSLGVTESINARLGYNRYTTDDTLTEDGVEYEAELELEGTSLLVDWHPFGGAFRLTGGVVNNGNNVTGTAMPSQPVEIGDTVYTPAQVGRLDADFTFDNIAPYVGVGWGSPVATEAGLSYSVDLGIMFSGSVSVDLDAQSDVFTIPESDIQTEENNLEDEFDEYDAYPIVRVGLVYLF
ncbi:MAG: hypothetical protein AAF420_13440 [Pseudomonadota bacterium]